MDVTSYLQLLRRWLWLIIFAVALAGGAAFLVARSQPPVYQTTATLQIGAFQELPNPDTRLIASAQGLAQTYFVLAKTRPFLETVIQRANLPLGADELSTAFEMSLIAGTPFFNITAAHGNAEVAAQIANTVADELVARTRQISDDRKRQIDTLQNQINTLTAQLEKDREELRTIDQRLQTPENLQQDVLNILVTRQNELLARVNQQQGILAEFQNSLITLQSQATVNVITLIETARVPERSIGVSAVRDAAIAGVIAGVLSIGLIALLEQLNTSIKSASELTNVLKLPLLGTLPAYGRKGTYKDRLIAWLDPRSPAAEAFRALRVNLTYMQKANNVQSAQVYVIASSRHGEGKSVTCANLAISFSNVGQQVVIVDADMRHPTQHLIFNLPNDKGLSDILAHGNEPVAKVNLEGDPTQDETFFSTFRDTPETSLLALSGMASSPFYTIPDDLPIHKTPVPGLHVITAGAPPHNPADILSSNKLNELLTHLIVKMGFEIVLIDTPPILEVSDGGVLASMIDAPVILVAEANRTRASNAQTSLQRFAMLSVQVLGVVLNRAKGSDEPSSTPYYFPNGQNQLSDKSRL